MAYPEYGSRSLERTCETVMLGRIGRELAHVYRDTLNAPLPARLQTLVDRLEGDEAGDDRASDSSIA